MAYDASGSLLASGGADSDIYVWDMLTFTGRNRLRGHKDLITGCVFVRQNNDSSASPKYLVSSSKDTLLKVWDLTTHFCVQTIVGHRCEIWSIALIPGAVRAQMAPQSQGAGAADGDGASSDGFPLILTGSADDMLRGYLVLLPEMLEDKEISSLKDQNDQLLHYCGCVKLSGGEHCAAIEVSRDGKAVATLAGSSGGNSGRTIQTFRIRDFEEMKKKSKRRLKRARAKNNLVQVDGETKPEHDNTDPDETAGDYHDHEGGGEGLEFNSSYHHVLPQYILMDSLEIMNETHLSHKARSLAFSNKVSREGNYQVLVSGVNNMLEVYKVVLATNTTDKTSSISKVSALDLPGHRSDVRCVTVSTDGLLIGSCSAEGTRIWNAQTFACVRSCVTGYGVSLAFAPGNRYLIVGTREGRIQAVDSFSGELSVDQEAHEGAVWSIAVNPDGKGLVSGSADKLVSKGVLGISLWRELQMTHDILAVRYSPINKKSSADKQLVAFGLLDNTIKVFYNDSMKFYLSLYGHKLPVMCLDISYDSTLLVSGSGDKTIKIWGLDFGDCHRSLILHQESITAIKFQPNTHFFFSCSKDGVVKYWDADRFEQILHLPGHMSSVWSLDVSPDGSYCVSAGQDRSLRVWKRGEDLVFIEEEKERYFEAQADQAMERQHQHAGSADSSALTSGASEVNGVVTIETLKGGERIIEALELVEIELNELRNDLNYKCRNQLLRGMHPLQYMVYTLKEAVKAPDLELALLVLPYHMVPRLLSVILQVCEAGLDSELCCKCVLYVLKSHQGRVITSSTPETIEVVMRLTHILRLSAGEYRGLVGTNIAALKYAMRISDANSQSSMRDVNAELAFSKAVSDKKGKAAKKRKVEK